MNSFSEHDLTIAERLGSIDQNLKSLNDSLEKERQSIWGKINGHEVEISKHKVEMAKQMRDLNWFTRIAVGVLTGIEAAAHWLHK